MVAKSYQVGLGLTFMAFIIGPSIAILNQEVNPWSVRQR